MFSSIVLSFNNFSMSGQGGTISRSNHRFAKQSCHRHPHFLRIRLILFSLMHPILSWTDPFDHGLNFWPSSIYSILFEIVSVKFLDRIEQISYIGIKYDFFLFSCKDCLITKTCLQWDLNYWKFPKNHSIPLAYDRTWYHTLIIAGTITPK